MRYIPHTDADVAAMLRAIGAKSVDDLFSRIIPERLRLQRPLDLPDGIDETTLLAELETLSTRNFPGSPLGPRGLPSFLGCGLVPHTIPTALDMLLQRSEFYTAYTPYQPEISQGTLQAIYEFQTMVAELFDLDVANASMYDGSTACAEALLMARRLTGRRKVLLAGGLHPEYVRVARTYLSGLDAPVEVVPLDASGATDRAALDRGLRGTGPESDVACVVVQQPSYLGLVEDLRPIAEAAHAVGALCVSVVTEPVALGVLAPPGAQGADIACGEGLGLALPPQMGGPGVGLFAARADHVRALPGRLVGETVDQSGRRGYVLTLATREQHIRRERATSNICTNEGLVALAFTINLTMLGPSGLAEMARLSYAKAAYFCDGLRKLAGYALRFPDRPHFNEIAVRVRGGDAARTARACLEQGMLYAGVPLGRLDPTFADTLLISFSEMHRKEDVDALLRALEGVKP